MKQTKTALPAPGKKNKEEKKVPQTGEVISKNNRVSAEQKSSGV